MRARNVSSNENCVKLFINVDLNVARLMSENNNVLKFIKIEFSVNFWVNQPLLRVFKIRRKIDSCWETGERDDWYLSNVNRNEGRLWATGWQGQMTAYMKHKTSNCGACVNDAIYLFYSIFFMFLSRYVFNKTIFLNKAI